MSTTTPHPASTIARETLGLGAAAFVLCALLGQSVFYKTDGPDLLWILHQHELGAGPLQHPWNVLYLPLLSLFQRGLALLGLHPGLLRLGELFSALGVALCVIGFRLGLHRLGTAPTPARFATLLLLLNPGTILFGTVVEFHAPLLAGVGLAFWWTAEMIRRPSWWGMAFLGLATHVAFTLHNSMLFLPCWLLPFFLAHRWQQAVREGALGTLVLQALVAGMVHAALFLLLPHLLPAQYGLFADLHRAFSIEGNTGRPKGIAYMPEILLQEWFVPLLPVSVTAFAALRRRKLWGEAAAFCLGMAPLVYICLHLLVGEPEHGAYLLPMVLPAALLTARSLPLRVNAMLVGLSAVGAFGQWFWHEHRLAPAYAEWVADLHTAAEGKPMYAVLGSHEELAMGFARLSTDEFLWTRDDAIMPRAQLTPEHLQAVHQWLELQRVQGRAVLLTASAVSTLEDPAAQMRREGSRSEIPPSGTLAGPRFLQFLREQYEFVPAAFRMDAHGAREAAVFRLQPKG
jgi:hypothetical protein